MHLVYTLYRLFFHKVVTETLNNENLSTEARGGTPEPLFFFHHNSQSKTTFIVDSLIKTNCNSKT